VRRRYPKNFGAAMALDKRGQLGHRVTLIKDCRITSLYLTMVARRSLNVSLSFWCFGEWHHAKNIAVPPVR
jgi:hypothetical protein